MAVKLAETEGGWTTAQVTVKVVRELKPYPSIPSSAGNIQQESEEKNETESKRSYVTIILQPNLYSGTRPLSSNQYKLTIILRKGKGNTNIVATSDSANSSAYIPLDVVIATIKESMQSTSVQSILSRDCFYEFCIPSELALYDFDRLVLYRANRSLGIYYPVTLRLLDRYTLPDPSEKQRIYDRLHEKWNQLSQQSDPTTSGQSILILQDTQVDAEKLYDQLISSPNVVCIACDVQERESAFIQEILTAATESGIPAIICFRSYEVEGDHQTEMRNEFYKFINTIPLNELPQQVFQMRRSAERPNQTGHIGRYLTLFWEDPTWTPYFSEKLFV